MARCKHLNGEMIEVVHCSHIREIRDGKVAPIGYNEDGEIESYFFHCSDCGKKFKLQRSSPKWLKKYHRKI